MKQFYFFLVMIFLALPLWGQEPDSITVSPEDTETSKTLPVNIKRSFSLLGFETSSEDTIDVDPVKGPLGIFSNMANRMMSGALVFGIIIYSFIFIGIILLIIAIFVRRSKQEKKRQELFLKYAELNQPIPDYLLKEQASASSNLKKGLIWLAVGLGCLFVLREIAPIPIFVGIAYLIIYKLGQKDSSKDRRNEGESR
ncbi:putative membrane protein [Parabacteroides sp. PFB2-10]|uniref:DUF6249 domain-containing protein n=1 Tax=Parabacteroides sp. PFB2-10 TaxID=1742405 RepID=UPI0024768AF4|nr:DUF6249 domain-containing protein [Parabacteroides sp. PFB2-10]MDH6313227.1 putative membrane protein [Parabacteroides sp. PFB2-10]